MAILVNMGQRGFILKEGFLAPGKEMVVDAETGKALAATYKNELKLICSEEVKSEALKVVREAQCEGPKEEVITEKAPKAKRKYTRKAK